MFIQNDFSHRKLRAVSAGNGPHGPIRKTGKRGLNHGRVNPERTDTEGFQF
jgi:hypothetical protein